MYGRIKSEVVLQLLNTTVIGGVLLHLTSLDWTLEFA